MPKYTTAQVARMVGIHKVTLQRWLLSKKLTEPRKVGNGGMRMRVWTERDVERVRKFKAAFYRKGRGRKKKSKS
jgi:DNA-binding transcriptional MerR regulator